eukprot:gene1534-4684_t
METTSSIASLSTSGLQDPQSLIGDCMKQVSDHSYSTHSISTTRDSLRHRQSRLLTPWRQQHSYKTLHPVAGTLTQKGNALSDFLLRAEHEQRDRVEEMNSYMKKHNLFTKFEAMVTNIAIERPTDHKALLLKMLHTLQDFDGVVTWDMFISPSKRPPKRPLPYWMTRGDEDDDRPTPEMYALAYTFNSKRILGPIVRAWIQWYQLRLRLKTELMHRLEMALQHYHKTLMQRHLRPWIQFKDELQENRRLVIMRMCTRRRDHLVRVVFSSWREYAIQSKLASQYFKRMSMTQVQPRDTLAQESDLFTFLPYHVRVKILSYVTLLDRLRCAMVCRTWREVAQDASLWNSVLFSELGHQCSDESIRQIVWKYNTFICKINMRGCRSVTNEGFSALNQCHNLQDLNVSDCPSLRDASIKAIMEGCPALIYLNLACSYVTDLSLKYISKYCSNLSHLSLACCSNISDLGCSYLSEGSGCSSLYWLVGISSPLTMSKYLGYAFSFAEDLSCCPKLSDRGIESVSKTCKNLSTVLLNDSSCLTDKGLEVLVKNCQYLTQLSLRSCPNITDEGLHAIGKHSTMLTHLELTDNTRVTADGVGGMCARAKITHITINSCPRIRDSVATSLSQQPLKYLDLSDCRGLTDGFLKTIAQMGPARTSLDVVKLSLIPRITDTGMRHFGRGCSNTYHLDFSHCPNISDGSMSVVLSSASHLAELNLSGCARIGDGTLQGLHSGSAGALVWLDLTDCAAVTDVGIEALSYCSPALKHLSLSGCTNISDEAFKELAFGCQRLEWLSVAHCDQLSDHALELIGTGCKQLHTLHLFGLLGITNTAFEKLLSTCISLRVLSISSSSHITRSAISRAQTRNPHLRIHFDIDEPLIDTQMPLRTFYNPETVEEFG